MGVVIALGAAIGGQLFKSPEPGIDGRMLMAESISLVISQRGVHPFHIRHEHQISGSRCSGIEKGAG